MSKPKFKVGQKVRGAAHTEISGTVCTVDDYNYRTGAYKITGNIPVYNGSAWVGESDIRPITKDWDNLETGDVLISTRRTEHKVFGVIGGSAVVMEMNVDQTPKDVSLLHIDYLQHHGFKIKDAMSPEIMHVEGKKYRKEDVLKALEGMEVL